MSPNLLDKLIWYVAPRRATGRVRARIALDQLRGYDGAANGKRTQGWTPSRTSVNPDNAHSLDSLRQRSRDLFVNNPYAHAGITAVASHVVGTGILPSVKAGGASANVLTRTKATSR